MSGMRTAVIAASIGTLVGAAVAVSIMIVSHRSSATEQAQGDQRSVATAVNSMSVVSQQIPETNSVDARSIPVVQTPSPSESGSVPVVETPPAEFADQSSAFRNESAGLGIHNAIDITRWIDGICIRYYGIAGDNQRTNDTIDTDMPINADEIVEIHDDMLMYNRYLLSHNPELIENDMRHCIARFIADRD